MTQYSCNKWDFPEFCMNAGETKHLRLPIYNGARQLIDAAGLSGRFAIADYVNQGLCLTHIDCETTYDMQCNGNIFVVTLNPHDTVNLCGKYIYQLTARDTNDDTYGVLRGIITIGRNIDKAALNKEE